MPVRQSPKNISRYDTPDTVERAIKELQKFFDSGKASLKRYPGRMEYGERDQEAANANVHPEMLAKARVFASEEKGYRRSDLHHLFKSMKTHRNAIGVSHIIRLVAVKDRQRRLHLQECALRDRWSVRDLDSQICTRFGSRRKMAGRKPTLPASAQGVEYELLKLSQKWNRFYTMLRSTEGNPGDSSWRGLTPTVKQMSQDVHESMVKLLERLTDRFPAG